MTAKFGEARRNAFLAAQRATGNQPFGKLRTFG